MKRKEDNNDGRTKFLANEDCNGCGREVDVNLIKKMNYRDALRRNGYSPADINY